MASRLIKTLSIEALHLQGFFYLPVRQLSACTLHLPDQTPIHSWLSARR
ncbi:Unknown protein sequence [Pseudomonas amygdali pv. sesami]|nr:Unknown protein sequence [Pseudomonas amygdali pv. sesami]KPY57117.1 hypothetical protein ALO93_102921 [Pseudomonas amygdali pv. sesami]RMT87029.1 hypothetical protein ALP38_102535 [Pseudomonas amygdali pv. sesami]RMT94450.1 hypothetical protein ALP37_102761 [Pseudomonas amygdali pv. sesami]RMV87232.1 hypothetical protein ALP04_103017 [Pseudomonas amygdali pv. sesami]